MFSEFVLHVLSYKFAATFFLMIMMCFAGVQIDQANWDSSKVREKLSRDIDAHIESVRSAKLSELTTTYEV